MQNISRENADIIGEVANICIGNAATTLSMILQKPTNITTPIVEVLKKEDALDHDDRILIKVPYTKGLDGTNLLIIKLNDALVIANLMMGGNGSNVSDMTLDEITLSAISEAMNQMCGTIATSMSSLLNEPTDIGFPLINSSYQKTFDIPDELCNGTDIVKCYKIRLELIVLCNCLISVSSLACNLESTLCKDILQHHSHKCCIINY